MATAPVPAAVLETPVEPAPRLERSAPAVDLRATPAPEPRQDPPPDAPLRTPREDRAQRRLDRQERARIRREAAALHASSATPARPHAAADDATPARVRRTQRGTVKWFSDAKGYGFIQGDDGVDVFVHRSGIVGDGFRTLHEGQAVEYEQAQSGKGMLAVDVVPVATGDEGVRR